MELKGKTIIVTGAARIGKFVVEKLIAAGANVAVSYRTEKPDFGSENIFYVQANLSNYKEVESLMGQVAHRFGAISGLVHMAATYERVPWEKLSDETWDSSMDAIAKSAFLTCKYAADAMLRSDVEGRIVLISDWSVLSQPYKDYLPYNAAKSAVVGLTKSLAKELAPKISVNAVAPGPIIRPPDLSEAENEEVMANTPLKRWGGGEEIAKAVLFFMDSDFTTGQILYIDGGRSIA